jgi:hypothetical protein
MSIKYPVLFKTYCGMCGNGRWKISWEEVDIYGRIYNSWKRWKAGIYRQGRSQKSPGQKT